MLKNSIKYLLTGAIILMIVSIALVFASYRNTCNKPIISVFGISKNVDMTLNKLHHVATHDGKKEWVLDAEYAQLIKNENKSLLKHVSITFFFKDGSKIYLKAGKGILKIDSNNIVLSENIILENDGYTLKTEKLYYNNEAKIISTIDKVIIENNCIKLSGGSASFDLNTKEVVLKNSVEGFLNEKT
ncbi:lipopolysaccharide export system protein LptC [Candidatus Magnetomoraceae bacterium gMMP-15]